MATINEEEAKLLCLVEQNPGCTRGRLLDIHRTLHPKASPFITAARIGWLDKLGCVSGESLNITEEGVRTLAPFKKKWGSPAEKLRQRKTVGGMAAEITAELRKTLEGFVGQPVARMIKLPYPLQYIRLDISLNKEKPEC